MDLINRTLGEFTLATLIGTGGQGQVYRARQTGLDREAVVKVLEVAGRTPAAVERFLREAKLASRLDHPYAAHVYAFGVEPDGIVWLAMELVRGTPLDRVLEQAPLAVERAVPFLTRLCEVVQTAHDQGIVHRDLKPANVLVISRAGSIFPKLIDLGIALDQGLVDPDGNNPTPIGTPFYMAPEQWTGRPTGAATDIYALGAMTYEILTAHPPFEGDSVLAVAMQHARKAPPPLPDGFAVGLNAAIARAMAKRPADRFASALDLAAALGEAAGVGAEVVPPPRLDEAARTVAMARSPQPIAEAVAVLDTARNPHQAQIALRLVVRTIAQYVGLVAIACRTRSGPGRRSDSRVAVDLLQGLRRRRLEVLEWWELARELCRPFGAIPDAYPIPELVAMLFEGVGARNGPMEQLVAAVDAAGGSSSDEARRSLADAMPSLAAVIREIGFLNDYTLVVPAEAGEIWMGVRPLRRAAIALDRAPVAGHPLLVDGDGRPVVSLWPLIQAAPPAPNAPLELFLLDGAARGSASLVSPPHGFERHDDTVWDWMSERLGTVDGEVAPGARDEVAPYHGLAAFQESDADGFLGRERDVEILTNRLRSTPLIAIVGPSGVGKSSFVRAGVLPMLRAAGEIRTLVLRPGHSPASGLSAQIGTLGEELDVAAIMADPEQVGVRLRKHAAATAGGVVVVVDQFEELFTLCRDPAERAAYARALCASARAAEDPIRIILTLRDDFLVRASALPELRERLAASLHVLTTPAREDLVRILVEPARRAGYDFEDAALVDEMVEAVVDRPGALALLSFTALQLWDLRDRHFFVLSRKAYAALGGVGGALGRHAEQTLAAMALEQQRLVRIAFRHLVTAEGTRAVIGEADLVAALAGSASDPQVARHVVERLIDARVVVVSEDDRGDQRIEIAHEALLDAWPRLIEWRREDADRVRFRDHLRAAAKQWDDRGRPRGLLWRGDALLEYQLWRSRFTDPLAPREDDFARASEAEASRSRRLRRTLIGTLLVAMAVVSVILARLSQRATASAGEARQRLVASLVEQGRQAAMADDHASAMVFLSEAYGRGATGAAVRYMIARAHRAEAAYDRVIRFDPPIVAFPAQRDADMLQLSPDGHWLVVGTESTIHVIDAASGAAQPPLAARAVYRPAVGDDQVAVPMVTGVLVWDLRDGSRHTIAGEVREPYVGISPDGRRIVLISEHGAQTITTVLDPSTDRSVATFTTDFGPNAPLVFHSGDRFAAVCSDKTLRVWDVASQAPVLAVPVDVSDLENADPTERRILTHEYTGDFEAQLWDVTGTSPPVVLHGHHQAIMTARISPDGTRVVTGSRDRTIKVWDAADGRLLLDLTGHTGMVEHVAFSRDGHKILSTATDRTARVWNAETGEQLAVIAVPDLKAAVFTPDGDHVITGTRQELKIWPARDPDLVLELPAHVAIPIGATFSADERWIATEDRRQVLRIWDRASGRLEKELAEFDLGDDSKTFLGLEMEHQRKLPAFDPAGARLFAPVDNRVAVWDTASGKRVALLEGHTEMVSSVRFSHDGPTSILITAGQDGNAIVWNASTLEQLAVLHEDGTPPLMYAELSPDGQLAVTAHENGVTLWRWKTRQPLRHFEMPTAESAGFSPDGRRIVSAGRVGRVVIWATDNGRQLATVDTASQYARAVRFAGDGLIVMTSTDGNTRVLDAQTLAEVARLGQPGTAGTARWAEVSPDARLVAVTGSDTTARVFSLELESGAPAAIAAWVRCEVPLAMVDSRIVPRLPDRRGCR